MGDDLASRNKVHFDKDASRHLAEWAELIQAVVEEFEARRSWMSSKWTDSSGFSSGQTSVRLLDYACGSGTASKWALLPFVTQAVGLDISPGMVAEYNKWAQDTGFGPERVQAYEYDLLSADTSQVIADQVSLSDFDIVVVSMALHHVSDPAKLLSRLAQCLRKGGVCVILDRVPESTSTNTPEVELSSTQAQVLQTINQFGFSEEDMRKLFCEAGLGHDVDYVLIERQFEAMFMGKRLTIGGFIAKGGLV
ncbi:hypothetical protein PV10_01061 [Exophiala mesophila]|uniref:Methyltransferase domain-containing protein n=1 Tax=Exophiala mesophila TaxID=212818 RepID=A0A0D1ZTN5_EXOME|nr:uncharacterized protein PV10_01061 [Exophiala mesophila]KIV97294.1 hypothetical protein PV10_01061 [Exophiala mesophila]